MKGALLGGCGGDPRETIGTLFIPTASVLIKKRITHTHTQSLTGGAEEEEGGNERKNSRRKGKGRTIGSRSWEGGATK